MSVQCLLAHSCMLSCRKTDYSEYPAVRPLVDNRQFAEVLVQRYQDALLAMGNGKNLVVSRILLPVTSPQDIVPGRTQLR